MIRNVGDNWSFKENIKLFGINYKINLFNNIILRNYLIHVNFKKNTLPFIQNKLFIYKNKIKLGCANQVLGI